ncbi:hypothetical protein [Nodularia sphaerocarpa]|uniref:hypothetical protein n=1 Tax=Nodularia sphaerocarpa TaxID=137816 RepID=UPI001EFAF52B|nr:hypothetical protein [Nodularia sphaerocarpa]MDB9375119.1 hypothetical protein [Nodularia sphaerocarpa CS-585]MDB9377781.1 hypothetical protein [Nodularia sphaerocarpa CS-585A2]ULP73500.1 hypothetical protein BDGGKGIB_03154 [Nodularia sphaerocarpa UHCC 0038]
MTENTNKREAHIIALYLAKFNQRAFTELGYNNLTEAYRQVSQALGYSEASIKNRRDSFDALLPNKRQGWNKKPPYKTVREVFAEFDNYEFEEFSKIVKNILQKPALSPLFSNLKPEQSNQLEQILKAEQEYKQQERSEEEKKCVLALWEIEGGKREVPIIDHESYLLVGIADLITDEEVIEVKNIKNWKHAVGQVFAYWYYFSEYPNSVNKQLIPRIHLFGGNGFDDYRIQLCESLMKTVFYPHTDSIKVTYAEDFDDVFIVSNE